MSIGTVGVANTVNTWGADTAWTQPAGMVDLKEDTEGVTSLTLLYPEMKLDSSVAEAGGSDGGNAGEAAIIHGANWLKSVHSTSASIKLRF